MLSRCGEAPALTVTGEVHLQRRLIFCQFSDQFRIVNGMDSVADAGCSHLQGRTDTVSSPCLSGMDGIGNVQLLCQGKYFSKILCREESFCSCQICAADQLIQISGCETNGFLIGFLIVIPSHATENQGAFEMGIPIHGLFQSQSGCLDKVLLGVAGSGGILGSKTQFCIVLISLQSQILCQLIGYPTDCFRRRKDLHRQFKAL